MEKERAIIQRVIEGDRDAFRYFVDQYSPMALSIALDIVHNRDLAADVVQEAFIKAFRKLGSFRAGSKFSTWFYTIVVNEAITATRQKRFFEGTDSLKGSWDKTCTDAVEELRKQDRERFITRSVDGLPPKDALLIKLFYYETHSVEEIAEITNLSVANVKVSLMRARGKLAHDLKKVLKHEAVSL